MENTVSATQSPATIDYNIFAAKVFQCIKKGEVNQYITDEQIQNFIETCWQSGVNQYRNNDYAITFYKNGCVSVTFLQGYESLESGDSDPAISKIFKKTITDSVNWRLLMEWHQWAKDGKISEQRHEALSRVTKCLQMENERLDLSHLDLVSLPSAIPGCVKHLKLQCNKLNQLPDKLPHGLIDLYINNNSINNLPEKFPYSLKLLNINNNPLTMDSEKFSKLESDLLIFQFSPEQIIHHELEVEAV